jgi:hypothetical protein
MLSYDRLRELLAFDPDTGHFTWRVKASNVVRVGDRAGCRMTSGRWQIRIDRKNYYASRLAFLYMTGEWPREYVDHINCDHTDNRWTNLREATPTQNVANRRRNSKCISGYKGVKWSKLGRCWEASIKAYGRYYYLGQFDDPAEAHATYVSAAREHFGEYARAA